MTGIGPRREGASSRLPVALPDAPPIDCGGVPTPDQTRRLQIPWPIKNLRLVAFVGALAAFAGWRFSSSLQGTDFPDFYCAARMLAEGHGHQLYDVEVQRQYQARYSG